MRNPHVKPVLKLVTDYNVRVFPVAQGSKTPIIKWQQSFSTGTESFGNFRKNYPHSNWGINCGRSNLIVIDIDIKGGIDGRDALKLITDGYGDLPDTFTVETPTGGIHMYYFGRCASSNGKLGEGLDVKSVGGFVLAPGCYILDKKKKVDGYYRVINDVQIAQATDWWIELSNEPGEKDPNRNIDLVDLDQENSIIWASEYLLQTAGISVEGQGGNDTAYKTACGVRDLGVSEYMTQYLMSTLWNDRCEPPWSDDELERIAHNANQYSQEAAGSKSPEADFEAITTLDLTGLPGAITAKERAELISKKEVKVEKAKHSHDYTSVMLKTDEFRKFSFPEKKTLLDPWVQESSILLLTGDPGVGKTWFAMSVAYAIATGKNFGPWETTTRIPVCYCEAEMAGVDQQYRLEQLQHGERQPDNFYYLSGAAVQQGSLAKLIITDKDVRKGITQSLVKKGVKFWVLDNLASTTPGVDENDKAAYDPVNQWIMDLRHIGITTMIVHHHNKAGQQRGTSGREDNVDLNIALQKPRGYQVEEGARFEVIFKKSRQFRQSQLARMVGQEFQLLEGVYADWTWKRPKADAHLDILVMFADGYTNAEIAKALDKAKSTVSNALVKGKESGYFDRKGKLTEKGEVYLGECLGEEDSMFD
ncbi:AAA family ATPase [Candidatus Pacearchaeota archaeon]|nr:AAA family ATPase [Candidatus Pacearchaeota archaeon]